ncbi:F-box protein At3g12350 [Impatiens glandulifera]|uniref:F-box protein At3g12350 n=1 Tax=Impatiens glandulifera TaxID=253017 RepID=UPI001FB08A8C|nr:F-box protein At3g12350 [Impatiens glandulifera]
MANQQPNPVLPTAEEMNPLSFSDFPEDVQLCILSFLAPPEISVFACTSKRFVSLCRNDEKLWFSLCDRRWGFKTQINKWIKGNITYRKLYKALNEYENLIGFWRRSGQGKTIGANSPPPLVFFEWGPSFITGSRVSPSNSGTYQVLKEPFLYLGIMANGCPVSYLDPECRLKLSDDIVNSGEIGSSEGELLPVNINFMGKNHVIIEENLNFVYLNSPNGKKTVGERSLASGHLVPDDFGVLDVVGVERGSPPDRVMLEIYQYFANRTSPGGERSSRRQRRREKMRQGKSKWEPEHFVKIAHCSPTPSKPLQGLWKGICDDMNLDFFLVAYDDVGGIACRRVGDASQPFSSYSPVFWTSSTEFTDSPFAPDEERLYASRVHLRPLAVEEEEEGSGHDYEQQPHPWIENEVVSRILGINSSYDLVLPDMAGTSSANPWQVEGRIWQYEDGTFGFGFLRNHHIIDLKHIACNGCLVDIL